MAAQAVDFTLSGQVSTAFSHVSNDAADPNTSESMFGQFGEASNRFAIKGKNELATGGTVGIQFELGAESAGASSPLPHGRAHLRHANIQYEGGFGKVTLGQGSEAGDGSAGSGVGTKVYGIRGGAHKQPAGYFSTLNAGGRADMIRYDTPPIGPITAAVSAANVDGADHLGTSIGITQAVGGTEFAGKLSTHNIGSGGRSIIGGAVGVKMPAGLIITGAWAKGKDLEETSAAVPSKFANVWTSSYLLNSDSVKTPVWRVPITKNGTATHAFIQAVAAPTEVDATTKDVTGKALGTVTDVVARGTGDATNFDAEATRLQAIIKTGAGAAATAEQRAAGTSAARNLEALLTQFKCTPPADTDNTVVGDEEVMTPACGMRLETAGTAESTTMTDPSYFQVEIGYNFGDTTVAATWYQSQDFKMDGSDGSAIGIGATHVLGKTGAKVFAAARKYDADDADGNTMVDSTVFLVGTVVTF